MPLYLFYTMVQKSQKWPKTQIKGGGPVTLAMANDDIFFVSKTFLATVDNQAEKLQTRRKRAEVHFIDWQWYQLEKKSVKLQRIDFLFHCLFAYRWCLDDSNPLCTHPWPGQNLQTEKAKKTATGRFLFDPTMSHLLMNIASGEACSSSLYFGNQPNTKLDFIIEMPSFVPLHSMYPISKLFIFKP